MNRIFFASIITLFVGSSNCLQTSSSRSSIESQQKVGGPCEGCEAIHESPIPFEQLKPMVWLPDWNLPGQKLAINGTVYKSDGKTPAAAVVLYVYHTDQKGIYPTKGDEKGWAKRHGYLRGWMKTDENGFYKFFTLKPASYPNSKAPAHIHITVKEHDKNEYWIDEFLFNDDLFLTEEERKDCQNRGGSGILTTKQGGNIVKAERNIYLGKNIPNYPVSNK